MNPLAGVGMVYAFPSQRDYRGTCFAYKEDWFWITGRHVIDGLTTDQELESDSPTIGISHASRLTIEATRVETHPSADLAVVIAGGGIHIDGHPVQPFETIESVRFGSDFWAFGYPIDHARGAPEPNPTPRLFKGHVQRLLSYSAPPFHYDAAEISMPAPRGLSGGPMFNPYNHGQLFGVVVANEQSYTSIESSEIELAPNQLLEREVREVVSYGVAVRLADYEPWIDEQLDAQRARWREGPRG